MTIVGRAWAECISSANNYAWRVPYMSNGWVDRTDLSNIQHPMQL